MHPATNRSVNTTSAVQLKEDNAKLALLVHSECSLTLSLIVESYIINGEVYFRVGELCSIINTVSLAQYGISFRLFSVTILLGVYKNIKYSAFFA